MYERRDLYRERLLLLLGFLLKIFKTNKVPHHPHGDTEFVRQFHFVLVHDRDLTFSRFCDEVEIILRLCENQSFEEIELLHQLILMITDTFVFVYLYSGDDR